MPVLTVRDRSSIISSMNRLDDTRRAQVIAALVEGNSIRSVCRMTGVAKGTVLSLLLKAGAVCAQYQDEKFQNLCLHRIQCDEIWSFCYGKDKNLPADKRDQFGFGSVWTWTAIDAETKLVPSWMVGPRDAASARDFIEDLASRIDGRIQLTTDGHKVYLEAVEKVFGDAIDYAMLIKVYGNDQAPEDTRYSPAVCTGTQAVEVTGTPDPKHISTSYVERQNLTMRMGMRRFTRLTNAFSKKLDNHIAAISLHFMYYNFVRIHQTLRMTPAMAAGVTDRLYSIADIVRLVDEFEKREKEAKLLREYANYGPALGH